MSTHLGGGSMRLPLVFSLAPHPPYGHLLPRGEKELELNLPPENRTSARLDRHLVQRSLLAETKFLLPAGRRCPQAILFGTPVACATRSAGFPRMSSGGEQVPSPRRGRRCRRRMRGRSPAPCGRVPTPGRYGLDIERLVTPCLLADDERPSSWIAPRRRVAPSSDLRPPSPTRGEGTCRCRASAHRIIRPELRM